MLVIHHAEEPPPVRVARMLAGVELVPIVRRAGQLGRLADPERTAFSLVVGSAPFRYGTPRHRRLNELDWVRRADAAGKTVLGLGHGARVLALALGGDLAPAEEPLRGWTMVDTAVPHLVPPGPWFGWQHDLILLPPRAAAIASNRFGPQAFRAGRHLGVQFHPEVTLDPPRTAVAATWGNRAITFRPDPAASRDRARRLLTTLLTAAA